MVNENIEIRREFWYSSNLELKKFFKRIQEVIKIIKPNTEYFTYDYLKELLRNNKLSEGYSKYIYLYLIRLKELRKKRDENIVKENIEINRKYYRVY